MGINSENLRKAALSVFFLIFINISLKCSLFQQ